MVYVGIYTLIYDISYIYTPYSVRESSPVMDSRVASYRPTFWKSKNIIRALKFGPRLLQLNSWYFQYIMVVEARSTDFIINQN